MTNKEIIKKVKEWQSSPHIHPFTCGNNSNHGNLKAVELDNDVILICPDNDCDYVQYFIPKIILDMKIEEMEKWDKKFREIFKDILE